MTASETRPSANASLSADSASDFGVAPDRREILAAAAALVGAAAIGVSPASAKKRPGKETFTILHTNDMHSAFIGLSPTSDYTPFSLNDDQTRGGYARLAGLIKARKAAREHSGPVLVLDAGDYSMGSAFAAASREVAAELQVMSRMGYDATTFGNHDIDLGPAGLAESIDVAVRAGHIPAIVAANTVLDGTDPSLSGLQRLSKAGTIRRYIVLERGGIRFGIFGVLGKEAQFYTTGAGAVTYSDANKVAVDVVKTLREIEHVDVVICLSHGGVEKDTDGKYRDGDDVRVAVAAPGIDVVIGGHSHTELEEPIIVNGRTPVVQTGQQGRNLGELVITLEGGKLIVESYKLHPIDDTVLGDHAIDTEIDRLKPAVTAAVFASRGYSIDQPLAVVPQDLPNTFTDVAASTILANFCTDAYRHATKADLAISVGGMMRAPLLKGKSGIQTVYDVFTVTPLGAGVVDETAGSALVTGYFNGLELKNILEFFLPEHAAHPGEYFPRVSGIKFHYDTSRSAFDFVTAIELGDFDSGYKPIDISGSDTRLYSLTCPLYLAIILVAIPKYSKGKLPIAPKKKDGSPLTSRVDALDNPRVDTPYILPPPGNVDKDSIATGSANGAVHEIKEWQAIMDSLRSLPVKPGEALPVVPVDARAAEVRAIKTG